MLRQMVRDLAIRFDLAGETTPLLDRVAAMVPGNSGVKAKGSPGKPSASKAPLDIQILDFLTTVRREVAAWEGDIFRIMDRPGHRPIWTLNQRLAHLPHLVEELGISFVTEALERDVGWWHERCLGYVVESAIERRYKPTHLAAEASGKSEKAFKSAMRRRQVQPVGYLPISFDGGGTRVAVWDMREVVARL